MGQYKVEVSVKVQSVYVKDIIIEANSRSAALAKGIALTQKLDANLLPTDITKEKGWKFSQLVWGRRPWVTHSLRGIKLLIPIVLKGYNDEVKDGA